MISERPLCSVVIPAYNTAAYIREAIDSALAQTYRPLEVVVVDDESTDDTPAILASYGDAIVAIRQDNAGPGWARNEGARRARGTVFAFLDSDDVWEPTRIERCIDALLADAEINAVTTDAYFIENDQPTKRRYYDSGRMKGKPFPAPAAQLAESVHGNFVFISVVIWRRDFEALGGFNYGIEIRGSEDYDLWIRLFASGRHFGFVDEPLAGYRLRPDNFTADTARLWTTHLNVLETRLPDVWKRGIRADGSVYFEIAKRAARAGDRRTALRFLVLGAQCRDLPLARRARAVGAGVRDTALGSRR